MSAATSSTESGVGLPAEPRRGEAPGTLRRVHLTVEGLVQGVGFRPYVHRLAREMNIAGWVRNTPGGVEMEAQSDPGTIAVFIDDIRTRTPLPGRVDTIRMEELEPCRSATNAFEIRSSGTNGPTVTPILPDLSICPECLAELRDPRNRRYRYPFINCTHCGPRYSIILGLPYDRPKTTMAGFEMCPDCAAEYNDVTNRRYHAQPNACPKCGPQVELWDRSGHVIARGQAALVEVATAIRDGRVAAVKGIGGFHLMVDARNGAAVRLLRERKHRAEKPFAVMAPDTDWVATHCRLSGAERRVLESRQAPIVLLRRAEVEGFDPAVHAAVAPGNGQLGVMLPYAPLHFLLMAELQFAVVATSANRSEEPICIDNQEALERLGDIADVFLVHDRPIARPLDDSIVSVVDGQSQILRRARGFAPWPVGLDAELPAALALGAHQKVTVARSVGSRAFVSQHIGDLDAADAVGTFRQVIADLQSLYPTPVEQVVCDAHPDYMSSQIAREFGLPVTTVYHHEAHIYSAIAENHLALPVLGVSWDGTGLGEDGTVWGGEFFTVTDFDTVRVGHLRTFPLPGGEAAARDPRRCALALLHSIAGRPGALPIAEPRGLERAISTPERAVLLKMLDRHVQTPLTSSVGRLFDAVASLLDLCQRNSFEGQAPMRLEHAIGDAESREAYPFTLVPDEKGETFVFDWEPLVRAILADSAAGVPTAFISLRFHNALAGAIVAAAEFVRLPNVVLSGGCFQNRYLLDHAIRGLREAGFHPYWQREVPCNDGGIALGQLYGLHLESLRSGMDDARAAHHHDPKSGRKSVTTTSGAAPRGKAKARAAKAGSPRGKA